MRKKFSCKYLPTNLLVKPIRTGGAAADCDLQQRCEGALDRWKVTLLIELEAQIL
jgi:hypothetical protein